jgi:hypothetical protein
VAETATHWRHSTARPMVTVAELLGRVAAVPRGSACTPAVCEHEPGMSVDALLRREGRATQAQERPAHPHGRLSATPDGGSPGRRLRTAAAVSTFLAAGSVVGVALSNNTAEYELGNTAQPVDTPPVGQSPPASTGGPNLVPGQQSPVLGAAASTGGLPGPATDWTSVAFPPTTGSSVSDPSTGSAETPDTAADAAAASGDEASRADAEPRDDDSGSNDDGDDGARSSGSDSRDSESTPASSSPQDEDLALADDGSDKPAPASPEAPTPDDVVPDDAAPVDAAPDGATPDDGVSGEESGSGGAGSTDDPDGQDTSPAVSDSTEDGPDVGDESGDSTDTDSRTDDAAGDSDATTDSSSADEPDEAEASDGGDGSAGEAAS